MTWQPRKGTVEIETPFCGKFVRSRRSKIVAPIRTARQYKDFVHLVGSLGDLERVDAGTVENSTPESGNHNRQPCRKTVLSIKTTDSYKGFKSIPEG